MRTNRKTEEKKMSMNKNIARLAVTAGLTAALSFGGVMAPVTMAFADDPVTAPANGIIIEQSENNKGTAKTRFVPYQIFKAKVHDGENGKVTSDVDWADTITQTTKDQIIADIRSDASNGKKLSETPSAQDVADWLGTYVSESGRELVVKNGDLLNKIAAIVKKNEQPSGTAFNAGDSFTPESVGYYLFLTDDNSIGTNKDYSNKKQTGTSPIFAVVGGTGVTVTEKTGIPTVTKKVKNDKLHSDWADKGDSQMDQPVYYQLTGTVAANIDTFNTYYYEFHDELSAGLTADENSITVKIDDETVTAVNNYTASVTNTTDESGAVTGQVLTVSFTDLKAAALSVGKTLTKDSHVVVTYTAKLDHEKAKNVVVGDEGNPNSVKLIYFNNPMSNGKGESVPDTVRDYTYALKLVKEDSANEATKLEGVKFTIQATGADEGAGTQYVQENGSLGKDPWNFTTDGNGEINIKGLDAGTYTVKETDTLGGYNTLGAFTFTIKADGLNQDEGNNTLTVTASKEGPELVVAPTFDQGTVTLTVKNKKGSNLPLTGLNGVTFTWIAGGAVLCIGVAHLIRSRKQAEESEQE